MSHNTNIQPCISVVISATKPDISDCVALPPPHAICGAASLQHLHNVPMDVQQAERFPAQPASFSRQLQQTTISEGSPTTSLALRAVADQTVQPELRLPADRVPSTALFLKPEPSPVHGVPSSRLSESPQKDCDRFLPLISNSLDLEIARRDIIRSEQSRSFLGSGEQEQLQLQLATRKYLAEIDHNLLQAAGANLDWHNKILSFSYKRSHSAPSRHRILENFTSPILCVSNVVQRNIPHEPERVLDAPDLIDDFYARSIDWGGPMSFLAVALGTSVYTWNPDTYETSQLMQIDTEANLVTSVRWAPLNALLAVGTKQGDLQLWDVNESKQVGSITGHFGHVGALSWSGQLVASGSQDTSIIIHDIRAPHDQHVAHLCSHVDKVCGVEWAPGGIQLASGGNDSSLFIWEPLRNAGSPRLSLFGHTAAVKALAWNPWQTSVLASGGGTADKSIKLWNTCNGECVQTVMTNSQVTSLEWNREYEEFVSAHGYPERKLCLWHYPTMLQLASIEQTDRLLQVCCSPDATTLVSTCADETLKFWALWPRIQYNKRSGAKDPVAIRHALR
ncbi:anaphase promoting complex protein [Pelomyxa schiedti]|nr:anaphase promoting complex protein [Pelomyxa schiedti]